MRAGMFTHVCIAEGCAAPAPFGFDVVLLKGELGRWSCREPEHRQLAATPPPLPSRPQPSAPALSRPQPMPAMPAQTSLL